MSEKRELSGKKARFVVAVLQHSDLHGACAAADIAVRTGQRYNRDAAVQEAITKATRAALHRATVRLARAAEGAADSLARMAEDVEPATPARVTACRAVLEHAQKLIDVEVLEERISALENAGRGTQGGGWQ